MGREQPTKRPPALARWNFVPIHKLPRHLQRLSDAQAIAWMLEATQLSGAGTRAC